MKTWLWVMVMGALGTGCQSSSSAGSSFYETTETDTVSALPAADASPCEALWKSLPALSLPYAAKPVTESPESREPFPPHLQSWLTEKLGSEEYSPLYTPIGQIRYPDHTLWLIEAMEAGGAHIYAILVSPECQIHDKLKVASFAGNLRYVNMISALFHTDGTFTLKQEYGEFDEGSPELKYAQKSVSEVRYRVDPERHRFVAL